MSQPYKPTFRYTSHARMSATVLVELLRAVPRSRSSARLPSPTSANGVRRTGTLQALGMTSKGDFVGGEMATIVGNGTSRLTTCDLAAMAAYIESPPATR